MQFDHAYLYAPGDARLVYNVARGQTERAFPRAVPLSVAGEWDAETLTMSLTLEGGLSDAITLTEQEIEDAKQTEAL